MTTYLAFNEAEGLDAATSTNTGADTTQTLIAGVCRAGFFIKAPASTTVNLDASFTAITEGWTHVRIKFEPYSISIGTTWRTFGIKDASGAIVVWLKERCTATLRSDLYVETPLSSTLVATGIVGDVKNDFDIHLKIDPVAGFVRVYMDNVLVVEETGDTEVTSGVTTFNAVTFGTGSTSLTRTSINECPAFSQVVVSSSTTLNCKLYTLTPSAGTLNTWASGTVTDVDETGVDDTDKAATATDGNQFTIDTSVTLAAATFPQEYKAVIQTFRANYDATSPVTKITPFIYDSVAPTTSLGTQKTLTTGIAAYKEIWEVDPVGAGDWTSTLINLYEYGVRADT